MKKKKIYHNVWIICMSLVTVVMLIPIIMMFVTSFKTMEEIKSPVFHLIPKSFSFVNYVNAMASGSWGIYFKNSLMITALAVVFSLLFNFIAGYAFARLKFRGSKILFMFLLIGLMMPPQVTMLPTFLIMAKFPLLGGTGLVNTYAGLIIPLVSGSFGVFLYKQFYENFPRSLDEAAEIDGTNKWQTYFQIYLPNSKAILATLALLNGYQGEKPFFMTISHIEPHHQNDRNCYEGPQGSKQRFQDYELPGDLAALKGDADEMYPDYLGCCRSLDDNLARVVDKLKEKNLLNNTIIVYSSDHGSHFRTRNQDAHVCGGDDYKRSCHTACLKVPLVIYGPGFTGGKRADYPHDKHMIVRMIVKKPAKITGGGCRFND